MKGGICLHNKLINVLFVLYLIKAQPKAFTLEEYDEDDDMEEDNFRASYPNITESSDSDVGITRQKICICNCGCAEARSCER